MLRLVMGKAARGRDRRELITVEIDNRWQCIAGGGLAEGFGQGLESARIFGLQGEEFRYRILPALAPAAAIGGLRA